MYRLLIVDDHAVTRAGYRQFLESEPGIIEIGEAKSGTEALTKLRSETWHLVLLDINMPNRGGLDVLQRIKAGYPDLKILVASGLPEEQYALTVLKAGAHGYLSKEWAGEELLRAVRTVMAGRRYVSDSLREALASGIGAERNEPIHARLTSREFQIFSKLSAGRRISDIADELNLSAKTVSTYRANVLEKLELKNNAEMTAYAMRTGLVQ
jgi:two-component system, NarL family, invasion response regulator UvrY